MAVTAAIGGAVIGGGAAIYAGSKQSSATKHAADTSAQASQEATQTQLQMYNQTRSDLQPFVQNGYGALSGLDAFLSPSGPVNGTLSQLSNLYGRSGPISGLLGLGPSGSAGMMSQLQNYPGYQFALSQGQQALDRSAASRGLALSGGQIKDSIGYGQGMAGQLYGTYLGQLGTYGTGLGGLAAQYGSYGNEIAGLVNVGQSSAAQTGNAGSAAAGGIGNALTAGAAQQGSSLAAAGTASASGIAGAANNIGGILQNQSLLAALNQPGYVSPLASYNAPTIQPYSDSQLGHVGLSDINLSLPTISDRRAKTEIKKVGKLQSGLNIYSYRLKGSPRTQIGVMSDEVRKVAPGAVRRDPRDGLDRVDYRKVSRLPALKEAA